MPAPYHTPTGNVSNFVDLFSYMNSLTSDPFTGLFGLLILLSIFIITFSLNANKELEVAFVIASWLTAISAIFLSMLEGAYGYLIPGSYISITLSVAIISVIILYMRKR